MESTLTSNDVFTAKTADERFDEFERILGPDKGWSDTAFNVVFDSNLTHQEKLAALRVERKALPMVVAVQSYIGC